MELVPWRPFERELSPFRRDIENLWSRFFSEAPFIRAFKEEWSPTVDVSEAKDNFIIKAELPGIDEKDVSVTISGDVLTIKSEKKKGEEEKDKDHYRAERYYDSFQRSFQLPSSIKADKIETAFDKGC